MAQSPASAASTASWKRYALIATAIAIVGAVLVFVFWPAVQISLWIGELHSDQGTVRQGAAANLAASTREGLDEDLQEVLLDPSASYWVRTQVGAILIKRNRLTIVEDALRSDDLAVRAAALAVLHSQSAKLGDEWFMNEVVSNPAFRVEETVLGWLERKGDLSREKAIDLAARLQLEDAVPALRLLTVPEREGVLGAGERRIIWGAARSLLGFHDCETLSAYADRIRSSKDQIVRLRLMQVLYEGVLGPTAMCQDAVPADTVKAVVLGALDDPHSTPKHGALLLLSKQPEWSKEAAARLLAILDGGEGDNVQARRAAMEALAKTGDEVFAHRLPRYFHSVDKGIRSQAVSASREYARIPSFPIRYESCWAGMLMDETENDVAFDNAVGGLRDSAGNWIGVPESVLAQEPRPPGRPAPMSVREKVHRFRTAMFKDGEASGLSRPDWARAWYDWWAKKLELTDDEVLQVREVRQRFRDAMARGDVAGAKKILAEAPRRVDGLYVYEGGWLQAQE